MDLQQDSKAEVFQEYDGFFKLLFLPGLSHFKATLDNEFIT